MKPMLAAMPEFLAMEEQIMNGVPQTLITLHRVARWEDTGADAAADGAPEGECAPPDALEGQALLIPKTLAKLNQLVTGAETQPARESVRVPPEPERPGRRGPDCIHQADRAPGRTALGAELCRVRGGARGTGPAARTVRLLRGLGEFPGRTRRQGAAGVLGL